jgi:hypothetical protein
MSDFDYHFHTELNLIEVHPAGVVQLSDILSYSEEILSLDLVTEGMIEYIDLSEMTNFSLDYQSAKGLTKVLGKWLALGWLGSVFFTPQEYQFGTVRMIGTITESLEGGFGGMMIPRRESTSLEEVRDLVIQHRRIS